MSKNDLIMGIHSIAHALMNPSRSSVALLATDESLKVLRKYIGEKQHILSKLDIKILSNKDFQNAADKKMREFEHEAQRVPASLLLEASPLPVYEQSDVFNLLKSDKSLKLVALDSVSDIQNGAAILRTAAFYGVDFLVIAQKGSFSLNPSFFRIASGGTEYVKILRPSSLVSFVNAFQERGGECIGLTEHASETLVGEEAKFSEGKKRCLVLGSEDKGISNAVERILKHKVSFEAKGQIKTLNVSVAATVAMERYF